MTFGVTEDGYNAKRLADILEEAEEDLSAIVDPVSGESLDADFSSDDPAMQVAKVPLVGVADGWESSKLIFDQFNPSQATDASLSGLVQLNGIGRQEPIASTDTASLTGTPFAVIPAGQIIADDFLTQEWTTDSEVTLDVGGLGSTGITNTVTGPIDAPAGTLTRIVTPVAGWQTVSNDGAVVLGRDEEEDADLRVRRNRSTLAPAATPSESVWANLRNLEGVTFVRVLINNTREEDSRGIPAKNQAVVIVGGDDEEIAKTILQRSGATVEFFGTTLVAIIDAQEEPFLVRFSRPDPVPIFVKIVLTVTKPNDFPSDGDELIRQAIIDYAAGGADALGILNGFNQDGFGPGSLVVRTRLFTPINSVPGHTVELLEIGLSAGTVAIQDIQTDFDQFPQFIDLNIDITVNF